MAIEVLRPFTWTLGGDSASKVAVLVTTLAAARSLKPGPFGEFIAASAVLLLAAAVWDMGVSTLLTRDCAAGRISVRLAVEHAFILRLKLSGIWLTVFVCTMYLLLRAYRMPFAAVVLFGASSLVYGSHIVFGAALRSSLLMKPVGLGIAGGRAVTAVAAAFLAVSGRSSLSTLAGAVLLGEIATLILLARATMRHQWTSSKRSFGSVRFRQALPFAGNSIINLAYNRFDVVILVALAGEQQLSRYAPASRIQDALYLIPTSLGTIALPLLASRIRSGMERSDPVRLTLGIIVVGLALTLPIAIGLFFYMPSLIVALLGPSYAGAALPTRILIWSMPMASVGAPLIALVSGRGRAVDSTKAFAIAFIAAATFHFSLDWWAGAIGAATASLVRDGVNVVVCLYFAVKMEASPALRVVASPADASAS